MNEEGRKEGIIRSSNWELNDAVGRALEKDKPDALGVQRAIDDAEEVRRKREEMTQLLRDTRTTSSTQKPASPLPKISTPIKSIEEMRKLLDRKK